MVQTFKKLLTAPRYQQTCAQCRSSILIPSRRDFAFSAKDLAKQHGADHAMEKVKLNAASVDKADLVRIATGKGRDPQKKTMTNGMCVTNAVE